MKTLICDLNVYDNGHHIAFVNSIMGHAARREDLLFLFNGMAATLCKGMEDNERVFFVPEDRLHQDELGSLGDKCANTGLFEPSRWSDHVERVIFLEIDWYQVAIGLSGRPPFRITGIYFRPFHLIPTRGDDWKGSLEKPAVSCEKRLFFHILKINRKVEPLFLLNDRMAGARYPSWFRYLPDPVFDAGGGVTTMNRSESIRGQFGIPSSTHIILAVSGRWGQERISVIS